MFGKKKKRKINITKKQVMGIFGTKWVDRPKREQDELAKVLKKQYPDAEIITYKNIWTEEDELDLMDDLYDGDW